MTSKTDLLRAELAALEAADAYTAVKADIADPKTKTARHDDTHQAAASALREARQAYRSLRDAQEG